MSPFAFLPALLAVLFLCRSPLAIASISEPTLSRATCAGDQVAVLDASNGLLNLSVNGILVQDRVLGCEKLRSYFGIGCLRCNQLLDAWMSVVKQYCGEGSVSRSGKLVLVCCLLPSQMRIGQLALFSLQLLPNCNTITEQI
jgi:hypothetical protein